MFLPVDSGGSFAHYVMAGISKLLALQLAGTTAAGMIPATPGFVIVHLILAYPPKTRLAN